IIAGVRQAGAVIAATDGVADAYRRYAGWVKVVPNRMPEAIVDLPLPRQIVAKIAYLAILDPMRATGVAPHYLDAMSVTEAVGLKPIHVNGGSNGSEEVFGNVTYTGRPLLPDVRYPRRRTGNLYRELARYKV